MTLYVNLFFLRNSLSYIYQLISDLQEVDYLFPLCTIHNPLSDPCPPKLSNKNTKRSSSRSSRSRFRSASVGANVVERSKKHWTGRPITREASPQKSPLERYSEFHRVHPPHAEEYQTFDGTPFPPRTGTVSIFS